MEKKTFWQRNGTRQTEKSWIRNSRLWNQDEQSKNLERQNQRYS